MSTIDKYILGQTGKPFVAALLALVCIFMSFTTARVLNDAIAGQLGRDAVIALIGIHTLIACDVLLPTALYIAVATTLVRMYRDSEIAALLGVGVGEYRILGSICMLSLAVAVLTAVLAIWVRPWAYGERYRMEYESIAAFDPRNIEAGEFLVLGDSGMIANVDRVNQETGELHNLFLFAENSQERWLISAKSGRLSKPEADGRQHIRLERGFVRELIIGTEELREYRFEVLDAPISTPESERRRKRRTLSLRDLAASEKPTYAAELQWRLSIPLGTFLLGLLAVPVSRVRPRSGKLGQVVTAIIAYAAIFNLASVARSWVENGTVPTFPGIWWVWLLAAGFIYVLLRRPYAS